MMPNDRSNIEKLIDLICKKINSIEKRLAEHFPTHAESAKAGKELAATLLNSSNTLTTERNKRMNFITLTEIDEERTIHVRAESIVSMFEVGEEPDCPRYTEMTLTSSSWRVYETMEEVLR
jgi:hypothetical protein